MALKITQKHLPMRKDTSNNPTEQEKTHGNRIKICKISELKMLIWVH